MLKRVGAGELPVIKLFLETLKSVEDVSKKLRAVFNDSGDIEILDSDPFHALLDNYGIPGDTMYYSRDGVLDVYFDFLFRGTVSADDVIKHIEEDLDALFTQYEALGDDMYEPLDMEKFMALQRLEDAS